MEVEADNLMPEPGQRAEQDLAEMAGASGNQYPHAASRAVYMIFRSAGKSGNGGRPSASQGRLPLLTRSDFGAECYGIVRRRRGACLPRIALATGIVETKIMFCVLVEILGGDAIIARRRFPRERDIALEYLMRGAADPDIGAVAVECLIGLRRSRLLFERPVLVEAAARPVIWS
jgi:hypothetical protein